MKRKVEIFLSRTSCRYKLLNMNFWILIHQYHKISIVDDWTSKAFLNERSFCKKEVTDKKYWCPRSLSNYPLLDILKLCLICILNVAGACIHHSTYCGTLEGGRACVLKLNYNAGGEQWGRLVHSHWSSSYITALSLVETFPSVAGAVDLMP